MTLPAPRSLHDAGAVPAGRLRADTEPLVVAAAVLGADCELADAAALAGLADPLPALQEAIGQRLLAEQPAAGRRGLRVPARADPGRRLPGHRGEPPGRAAPGGGRADQRQRGARAPGGGLPGADAGWPRTWPRRPAAERAAAS